MTRSFSISVPTAIAIEFEDRHLDVHNNFRLGRIDSNRSSCEILITFEKLAEDWVDPTDPEVFQICFNGVTHLEHSFEGFESVPEDVDQIGFKNPDDADYDWLLLEDQAEESDHLIFRFMDDEYLRIFAKDASVRIP